MKKKLFISIILASTTFGVVQAQQNDQRLNKAITNVADFTSYSAEILELHAGEITQRIGNR